MIDCLEGICIYYVVAATPHKVRDEFSSLVEKDCASVHVASLPYYSTKFVIPFRLRMILKLY